MATLEGRTGKLWNQHVFGPVNAIWKWRLQHLNRVLPHSATAGLEDTRVLTSLAVAELFRKTLKDIYDVESSSGMVLKEQFKVLMIRDF